MGWRQTGTYGHRCSAWRVHLSVNSPGRATPRRAAVLHLEWSWISFISWRPESGPAGLGAAGHLSIDVVCRSNARADFAALPGPCGVSLSLVLLAVAILRPALGRIGQCVFLILGSFSALFTTTYGQLLVTKLLFFGALMAVAALEPSFLSPPVRASALGRAFPPFDGMSSSSSAWGQACCWSSAFWG